MEEAGLKNDLKSNSEEENVAIATICRPIQGTSCPNKMYGIRTKEYQMMFLAKGVHNGRAVYTWSFEDSLRKSLKKGKEYDIHMMAIRRSGDMNMAMKVGKLGRNGSVIYVNQTVFVRKLKKHDVIGNTTESLKEWAKKLIHGISHQECRYRVPVAFQADMMQLDSSDQLQAADTVLMDEDVVRLVNARYKSKVSSGEFFELETKVRTFFSSRRSLEEIKMLFL